MQENGGSDQSISRKISKVLAMRSNSSITASGLRTICEKRTPRLRATPCERFAAEHGRYAKDVNGDAFSEAVKPRVIEDRTGTASGQGL